MPISIEEAIAKLKGIGNKTSTRNMTSMVDHNENCHFDFELYRTCIEHTHIALKAKVRAFDTIRSD